MTQHNEIKIFGEQQVRSVWDDSTEEWYFAVVDVVAALTDSVNPSDYIKKMRQRDPELAKGWERSGWKAYRREPGKAGCWGQRSKPWDPRSPALGASWQQSGNERRHQPA